MSDLHFPGYRLINDQFEGVDSFRLALMLNDAKVGMISYAVCNICNLGRILKISIYQNQRAGLGTHLIAGLRNRHPGIVWWTTNQIGDAPAFWAKMSAAFGDPYDTLSAHLCCEHPSSGEAWVGPLDFPIPAS